VLRPGPPAFELSGRTLASVGVFVGLVAIAALVRWPQLQMIPPYTDETEESLRAWAIYSDGLRPLVNVEPYIGAFWNYAVASLFLVFGRDSDVPRQASLVAGALTVGMTYVLGRLLYGHLAGVVAALLLAGNATHILVNSHVAWSNCVTPLFTTTAFWLLVRALDRPASYWRLGAAGVAWGLALQTHPSVVVCLPGAALYALHRHPRLAQLPQAWAGALLFLAAYGNVLLYNVESGFGTIVEAQRVGSEYAGAAGLGLERYWQSVLGSLILLAQATAGVVDARLTVTEYLLDPRILVAVLAVGAAVWWSVRRRQWLLLLVAVPMFVVLPALNQRWQPILASRYIMPLIPLLCVVLGGVAADTLARRGWRPVASWGVALAVVGLVMGVQVVTLQTYYRAEAAAYRTNAGTWLVRRLVLEQRRSREVLIVHADARRLPTGGGGNWARVMNYFAIVHGVPVGVGRFDPYNSIRACDVQKVELRHVERGQAFNPPPGTPSHEGYWVVRHARLPGESRAVSGIVSTAVNYTLPWRQRSLFDPLVTTFETGCDA
jgi:4-amino-4-deoxy-L-arabinose transferase-like glycosyltransferase